LHKKIKLTVDARKKIPRKQNGNEKELSGIRELAKDRQKI
jgi:hypothetical protein